MHETKTLFQSLKRSLEGGRWRWARWRYERGGMSLIELLFSAAAQKQTRLDVWWMFLQSLALVGSRDASSHFKMLCFDVQPVLCLGCVSAAAAAQERFCLKLLSENIHPRLLQTVRPPCLVHGESVQRCPNTRRCSGRRSVLFVFHSAPSHKEE